MTDPAAWSFETRQIHAGTSPDPTTGARALPIYATTAYQFRDSQHVAELLRPRRERRRRPAPAQRVDVVRRAARRCAASRAP